MSTHRDGAERSGLYSVISAVLERLQNEQKVNIPQVILQQRGRRPQIIHSFVRLLVLFKFFCFYMFKVSCEIPSINCIANSWHLTPEVIRRAVCKGVCKFSGTGCSTTDRDYSRPSFMRFIVFIHKSSDKMYYGMTQFFCQSVCHLVDVGFSYIFSWLNSEWLRLF